MGEHHRVWGRKGAEMNALRLTGKQAGKDNWQGGWLSILAERVIVVTGIDPERVRAKAQQGYNEGARIRRENKKRQKKTL